MPLPLPRVLLVGPTMRYMGGQAVIAARLRDSMARDGNAVDLLPIDPELPRWLGFARRLKYLRTLVVSLFYVTSLLRKVPRFQVIHVFSASYFSFLLSPTPAILVGRLFRKPVLLNYHSGQAEDHLRRWRAIVLPILRLPDRIVVPSPYLVQVFAQFGFEAVAIANVVDETTFRYRLRERVEPRILVPRALEPEYNVACAIRAFQLVQQRYPKARLTILGDGSQRRELERLVVDLHLEGVHFAGRVERDRITNVFDQHDMFLNTSSIDNMPVSILEAFAAGLPVVTTNAGGIPLIVTDRQNGHMVAMNDHRAVAARVMELVENPEEVVRLSRRGGEEIRKYRWEAVAAHWYALYREMSGPIAAAGSPPGT